MSRKIRIFMLAIAAVLVGATILFLTVNNSFVSPYFIQQKRNVLSQVCQELLENGTSKENYIADIEKDKGVVIATVPNTEDNNLLNEQLREAFLDKGLGLSKYWLWEEDYNTIVKQGTQQRVYGQGNLGYSLLVQYMINEDRLVAVATVLPHLSRPLTIANGISAVIMGTTALLLMVLVWWMSRSLEKAQNKVTLKNQQMKQLLNSVSHDLKTPIALIKAYTSGMKDGMDDGSFLDTIVEQNNRMELLTLRLLALSKYEEGTQSLWVLNLSDLLSKELERQMPLFTERNLIVESNICPELLIESNPEPLITMFDNLLSNAIKYATVSPVKICLYEKNKRFILEVKNPTDLPETTKTDNLWEPFCVGEGSRNSTLSGGGLGLSLVRAAANAIGASSHCEILEGEFVVVIEMEAFCQMDVTSMK